MFLFQSPQCVVGLSCFDDAFTVIGKVAEEVNACAPLQFIDAARISLQVCAVVVFVLKPQTEGVVLSVFDAQDGGKEIFRDDQSSVGTGVVVVVEPPLHIYKVSRKASRFQPTMPS